MEYEIELKLLTTKDAGELIDTKVLGQIHAKVIKETQLLTNRYFDTSDRTLREHDIGLRIRGNNKKFEQTLKTAGQTIGGLQRRPEYNVSLDESKGHNFECPQLKLFPASAWPTNIDVGELQSRLDTLFTTHFTRHLYQLTFLNGDVVELVWDYGEVTSGNRSLPICEIELELKQGNTTAIFDVARKIVNVVPTFIGTQSKAARGYSLLSDFSSRQSQPYSLCLPQAMPTKSEDFAHLLTQLLDDLQQLLVQIRHQYSHVLASDIKQVLDAFAYYLVEFIAKFPCSSLKDLSTAITSFINQWLTVMQQNNQQAADTLLSSAHTTQMQLDITQVLVEKPWRSNL